VDVLKKCVTHVYGKQNPDLARQLMATARKAAQIDPTAGMSLVDEKYRLVGWNAAQQRCFPALDGLEPGTIKCHKFYNDFVSPCSWCLSKPAMQRGRVFSGTVSSPKAGWRKRRSASLVYSDIYAIPCGMEKEGRYSHCLEGIHLDYPTKRVKREHGKTVKRHDFVSAVIRRLQEKRAPAVAAAVISFGAMFGVSTRVRRSAVALFKGHDPTQANARGDLHTAVLQHSRCLRRIHRDFLNGGEPTGPELVRTMRTDLEISDDLAAMGLEEHHVARAALQNTPLRLPGSQRAIAVSRGARTGVPERVLVFISTEGTESFLEESDLSNLDSYVSFVRQARDVAWLYSKMESSAAEASRLKHLSEMDGLIATMMVAWNHWASKTFEGASWEHLEMLLSKIPYAKLKEEDTQTIIGEMKSALRGTSQYFSTLQRYRKLARAPTGHHDACKLLRRAAEEAARTSQSRRVDLRLRIPKDKIKVLCNPDQLQEAFRCIIQNAFEALQSIRSGRGLIRVDARAEKHKLRIEVIDNGPGYPEGLDDVIWMPNQSFNKEDGTGVGLAFTKAVVVGNLGGSVSNSMEPGKQTQFILRLPLIQAK